MKTKKCVDCGKTQTLDNYCKHPTNKDGFGSYCKKCLNKRCIKYRKTKNGIISGMYTHQLRASEYRCHPLPTYTKGELKEWLFSQKLFHELYDKWIESGYDRWLKPSIDRLDDYKGYSFDNIQLVTWRENNNKAHHDRVNGINNKYNKAVRQYDLDGNFIKEYYSVAQAERETGVSDGHICSVCKNKRRTAGGFVWKYKLINLEEE